MGRYKKVVWLLSYNDIKKKGVRMGEIFKAYDIRGLYPQEIDKELVYKIGRAFVTFLDVKEVVIGRDMRDSSDELFDALAKGINDQGADVIDIGICTTPMLYFGIAHHKRESGIMITASHNPKQYNGLKMCREKAIPLSGDTGIKDIKRLVEEDEFPETEKKGSVTKKDISAEYHDFILNDFEGIDLDQNIVVDAANSMGALDVEILKKKGLNVKGLYLELDGNFPNHEANPLKEETLDDIKSELKAGDYELGIAFDGDADRAMFLTEDGEFVRSDFITTIIAKSLMQEGEHVLYDLRSSKIVPETVESLGGKPIISRVGHAFIKATMKEKDAVFGGEVSGHYYFRKMAYCESAVLASLYILKLMKEQGKKLSEIVEPLRKYSQSGEINFEVENKKEVMEKLKMAYPDAKTMDLDGITIDLGDWWCNVRASNTEPLLRLNLEAQDDDMMKEKVEEIRGLIGKFSS